MTNLATTHGKACACDKLPWLVPDEVFVDGSKVSDWTKIESFAWVPQQQATN